MTDQIPVKAVKSGGAAVALGEYEAADRIPSEYLNLPKGYIDGLKMEWVSATSYRVTSGSCYIPSLDRVVPFPSAITKSGLTLTASTWYHLFGFLNAGVPDIEAVTAAPASPYNGTARAKTSDTSRRYIGSFLTSASSAIIQFQIGSGGIFEYRINSNVPPLRCLVNGTATTRTTVSLAPAMPLTATAASLILTNTASGFALLSVTGVTAADLFGIPSASGNGQFFDFVVSSSQSMDYYYPSATANGLYIDVRAFKFDR